MKILALSFLMLVSMPAKAVFVGGPQMPFPPGGNFASRGFQQGFQQRTVINVNIIKTGSHGGCNTGGCGGGYRYAYPFMPYGGGFGYGGYSMGCGHRHFRGLRCGHRGRCCRGRRGGSSFFLNLGFAFF